ncbi:MAG TPA: hypothetical protein VHL11_10845 [Phototrophicaceae bacterium]|jgi:hypothetical protein|nr:hypothetical protein [Phototrophicaceae bacterium]
MNQVDELLRYLFDQQPPDPDLADWLKSSRTFRLFVETFKDKIRRKIRTTQDDHALKDLKFELQTAYSLLQDRRFAIDYEKYGALQGRGADFTVAFRVNTVFNLEVTRLRQSDSGAGSTSSPENMVLPKLIGVIGDKAGQTRSGMINVLMIAPEMICTADDLKQAVNNLKRLADNKQEDFFTRRGYSSAGDFLKYFWQLSAIVICQKNGNLVWLNTGTKKPLIKELVSVFEQLNNR